MMKNSLVRTSFTALVILLISLHPVTHAGWVDPDTPEEFRTVSALTKDDHRQYQLIFSDEFEQEGRKMDDGNDPRWTAIHKNDYTNRALQFYSKENVLVKDGVLNIVTNQKVNLYKAFDEKAKTFYSDKKHIQSGMVQTWNKFCFIGGVIEFSVKLPGDPRIGGLWPALWMLGNLARATYVGSSDYVWPYSFNKCVPSKSISQEINACKKVNHYGMFPYQGRGSPEIDIIEAMQGIDEKLPNTDIRRPYQSASLQVAPGIERDRPKLGELPRKGRWYEHLEYGANNISQLNPFFYGSTLIHKPKSYSYQADGLSANRQLNSTHYESQHLYRVEWEPPAINGTGGYIRWYTDEELIYGITADSLDIMGTEIPSEPMYLLINTAVSDHWGFPQPCPEGCECECFECNNPDCACALPTGYCDNFPANYEIEYVRVYQPVNSSTHFIGCSPPHRPTDLFIKGHRKRYIDEFQKRPLEPIRRGGGPCSSNSDCGGPVKGQCSMSFACICKPEYTGPNCLAHAGKDDNVTTEEEFNLHVAKMIVPRSAIVFCVLFGLGFLCCFCVSLRHRVLSHKKYQKIGVAYPVAEHAVGMGAMPGQGYYYQQHHPANGEYVLPPAQKVVTYCVIDGRLVDQ